MRSPAAGIAALLMLAAGPLRAETSQISPTGFTVTVVRDINTPPSRVWRAIGQVDRWWSPEHTWSGNARNLSLLMRVGGCFCERWPRGDVEHGRVINATDSQVLRLLAPLGPLQALPVNAVLTFTLAGTDGGTRLTVTYLVAGGGTDLAALAGPVDSVITGQVDRLASHARTP